MIKSYMKNVYKGLLISIVSVILLSGCTLTKTQIDRTKADPIKRTTVQTELVNLPLEEQDVKSLMAEKMNIEGWEFSKEGNEYSFSFKPTDPNAEGSTYHVNANTGTVYADISGSPLTNLVVKDAPNFIGVSNGTVYQADLFKLINQILADNRMVVENDDWFTGFMGDGYLFGDVKKNNKIITIKMDAFTKDWEEIKK